MLHAKGDIFGGGGIDGIYGRTEAVVIAYSEAHPGLVAADLLAEAEHEFLAIGILLTDCASLVDAVPTQGAAQMDQLDRKEVAQKFCVQRHARTTGDRRAKLHVRVRRFG